MGLEKVADGEPATPGTIVGYVEAGRAWVAVTASDRVVGYILVGEVDGDAHIAQVSVHPQHQGTGLGRSLINQAEAWARQSGRGAVTLTTFADVPWNRPLYEHLGFKVLASSEVGPQLRGVFAEEAGGVDPTTRVCMRLVLTCARKGRSA